MTFSDCCLNHKKLTIEALTDKVVIAVPIIEPNQIIADSSGRKRGVCEHAAPDRQAVR